MTRPDPAMRLENLLPILNALPGSHLILLPDAPLFTIIGVTNSYLSDTSLKREEIVGRSVFEAFAADSNDAQANDVENLSASLNHVLKHKEAHSMAEQQYDMPHPESGKWERRVLQLGNKPVLDSTGNVQYIIHWAEDVTEKTGWKRRAQHAAEKLAESESRFRNMADQAPIAIVLTRGPDIVIESMNTYMLQLINKPPDANVIGKKMLEVLPELKDQPAYKRVQSVQETGIPFRGDELPVDLVIDGKLERRYFNLSYTLVTEDKDRDAAVLHLAVDVTKQVEAAKKLAESEQRFRLMADVSPYLVWMLEADGSYKYINQTTLDYLGVTQEEMVANGWAPYMHPDDLERVTQAVTEAVQAQKPYTYEHQLRNKNGDFRWVFSQAVPHFAEDGTVYAYIGASVDIHDQRAAKEKLEASEAQLQERVAERTKELSDANETLQRINKELQRSNVNLEEFAHAASHDLKEPIRKIHFFTEQLKRQLEGHLSETERRSFGRIENATQRMGHLIDDLLLYSHVSQKPHEKERVDLNEKVSKVLEDLDLDIDGKGATVHIASLPAVSGYRRQLQQLFQNLIGNALKYSKADIPPIITITAERDHVNGKPFHVISVRDNGIGFEQQYADKIFQMFSRLHGKGEYGGTGVGLSIVKKVAENHDGFIQVESVPGEGSTFRVYLPAL